MKGSVVIEVPLVDKIKFLAYACYLAIILFLKNFIWSFWRKPVETVYPDKPLARLVGNGLGNHSYIKVNVSIACFENYLVVMQCLEDNLI